MFDFRKYFSDLVNMPNPGLAAVLYVLSMSYISRKCPIFLIFAIFKTRSSNVVAFKTFQQIFLSFIFKDLLFQI